jgi:hypothetical protein
MVIQCCVDFHFIGTAFKCSLLSKKISTVCAAKPSASIVIRPSYTLEGIRKIEWTGLDVGKQCIGGGVFGKCYGTP